MANTANYGKRFGVMLDMSRNAVMRPEEVKRFAKLIRSFGYNMIQLYTEDTYEVDGEPYFGYMRGRYSKEELADIVSYCNSIGMEVIPCIQTLAHLNQLFRHGEYAKIRDTADILLVGDERTYELIENMFKTLRGAFTSDYIHIGMDEAHMLGLGKYLDRNGYENRFDILSKHLTRVIEIAKKYGFTPIMWSDMFFRLANHGVYYTLEDTITEEIVSKCPDGVELVYWDYYHKGREYYDNMIDQHRKFGKDVWFAGGAWCWSGFASFNGFAIDTMSYAMEACADKNIENVFFTMWGDDGKECSFYSLLPSLFTFRKVYEGISDPNEIKRLFKEATGEDFDAMMALDLPNLVAPNNAARSTVSKVMLYNDPLMGIYDTVVTEGAAEDFKKHAETLYGYAKDSAYAYIFESSAALCELLSVKYDLGMRSRKAYKNGKEELKALLPDYDRAIKLLDTFHANFRKLWMKENKPFGFEVQEIRLGGLMLRMRTARNKITAYIKGELESIEEFDMDLLEHGGPGTAGKLPNINSWEKVSSANALKF